MFDILNKSMKLEISKSKNEQLPSFPNDTDTSDSESIVTLVHLEDHDVTGVDSEMDDLCEEEYPKLGIHTPPPRTVPDRASKGLGCKSSTMEALLALNTSSKSHIFEWPTLLSFRGNPAVLEQPYTIFFCFTECPPRASSKITTIKNSSNLYKTCCFPKRRKKPLLQ